MSQPFEVGQFVTGINKTGKYIGEITVVKDAGYVMRVLAVLKHPQQGDLHNPKMVDVGFFHERKALAYREQVNIPTVYVKLYEGDIPSYEESLKTALAAQEAELKAEDTPFARKSLEMLESLKKDYFKS